jgi:hypothetical protein
VSDRPALCIGREFRTASNPASRDIVATFANAQHFHCASALWNDGCEPIRSLVRERFIGISRNPLVDWQATISVRGYAQPLPRAGAFSLVGILGIGSRWASPMLFDKTGGLTNCAMIQMCR